MSNAKKYGVSNLAFGYNSGEQLFLPWAENELLARYAYYSSILIIFLSFFFSIFYAGCIRIAQGP